MKAKNRQGYIPILAEKWSLVNKKKKNTKKQ
jgi:hypothetical protein